MSSPKVRLWQQHVCEDYKNVSEPAYARLHGQEQSRSSWQQHVCGFRSPAGPVPCAPQGARENLGRKVLDLAKWQRAS